jgi:hypothetical protein
MTWITVKRQTQRNQMAGGITTGNKTPINSVNQAITSSVAVDGNEQRWQPLQLPPFLPRHAHNPSVLEQRRGGHNGDSDRLLFTAVDGKQEEGKAAMQAEGS